MVSRLLILFISFLSPALSKACICNDFRSLDEHFTIHQFIAHVKITDKQMTPDSMSSRGYWHTAIIKLQVIELFKGSPQEIILEDGVGTSCNVGLQAGEEWILFARFDSVRQRYTVGACTPSRVYRNKFSERQDEGEHVDQFLKYLQQKVNHPVSGSEFVEGNFKVFYPNKALEWEANFHNSQLHGNRKLYYASGRLKLEEVYSNGKREGWQRYYSASGQLLKETFFRNGMQARLREWADSSKPYRYLPFEESIANRDQRRTVPPYLLHEYYFSDSTHSWSIYYYQSGETQIETLNNLVVGEYENRHFYRSGKIKSLVIRNTREKKEIIQEWDESGNLLRHNVFLMGKLIEKIK